MNPLIVTNSDATERFSQKHVSILKDTVKCDDIHTYQECGWFCVAGFLRGKRVVHAHCDSYEQYEAAMYPEAARKRRIKEIQSRDDPLAKCSEREIEKMLEKSPYFG